jgi:hypothetical protein
MKNFITLFFGLLLSFQAYSEEMSIEQIYEKCQMVEDTVDVVVHYRDGGTSREEYISLVDEKMIEMGIKTKSLKLFNRVHWFINYIYNRPNMGSYDLKVDIDFLCKSEMMDGGWW